MFSSAQGFRRGLSPPENAVPLHLFCLCSLRALPVTEEQLEGEVIPFTSRQCQPWSVAHHILLGHMYKHELPTCPGRGSPEQAAPLSKWANKKKKKKKEKQPTCF